MRIYNQSRNTISTESKVSDNPKFYLLLFFTYPVCKRRFLKKKKKKNFLIQKKSEEYLIYQWLKIISSKIGKTNIMCSWWDALERIFCADFFTKFKELNISYSLGKKTREINKYTIKLVFPNHSEVFFWKVCVRKDKEWLRTDVRLKNIKKTWKLIQCMILYWILFWSELLQNKLLR